MKKKLLLLAALAFMLNACADDKKSEGDIPCANGNKQCNADGIPVFCVDGAWVKQEACPAATPKCIAGLCKDKDAKECQDNALSCNIEGVPQKCQDGSWVKQQACESGKKCLNGDCVPESAPECTDGAKQCSVGGLPQICENKKWKTLEECKSGEQCHKKSGECDKITECTEAACKAMSADKYMGNICVDGTMGKNCGCKTNDNCNTGFTCDTITEMCVKSNDQNKPPATVCLGHAKSTVCDGANLVTCSATSAEVSKQNCAKLTGNAYKGEICTDKSGTAQCGCNASSDCKSGYECKSNVCTKKTCDANACADATDSNYLGNACVDGHVEGEQECGCSENTDCKSGYTCNQDVSRCQKENATPTVCSNISNGSALCQNNSIIICENGKETSRTSCRSMTGNSYLGNICSDKSNSCGCEKDSDCKIGYTCGDKKYCVQAACSNDLCRTATGTSYKGNICVEKESGAKTCGCNNNDDCKDGYQCSAGMKICYKPSGTDPNTNVCEGKANATVCSGSNVVFCKNNAVASKISCPDVTSNYSGDTCVTDASFCGCTQDSDCKAGYQCNTTVMKCELKECTGSACESASDANYTGNVCVAQDETTSICGCTKDADCKSGYHCNTTLLMCTEFSGSTSCVGTSGSTTICDGDYAIECDNGYETYRYDCKNMTGLSYYGNTCVKDKYDYYSCGCTKNEHCKAGYQCDTDENYCVMATDCNASDCSNKPGNSYQGDACVQASNGTLVCGCNTNDDCKGGYECENNVCKKLDCYAPICASASDSEYRGNVCVAGYNNAQMCGCWGPSDCKTGFECNTSLHVCKPASSTVCNGKPNNSHVCDGNVTATCNNNQVTDSYPCGVNTSTTPENFVGTACLEATGTCGCNTNSDCSFSGGDFECNSQTHTCVESCKNDECAAATGSSYQGDVCVNITGEKKCGCMVNLDCKDGYICGDNFVCVQSNCSETACRAQTGTNYKGNICVQNGSTIGCGCEGADEDCRSGYDCNLSTMTCEKVVVQNICENRDDEFVCDENNTSVYCIDGQSVYSAPCHLENAASYLGNICMSDGTCGCSTISDCRDGYLCDSGKCVKSTPNICYGKDGKICDGNELVYCDNSTEIAREICSPACISNNTNSFCGCSDSNSCALGLVCVENQCVSNIIIFDGYSGTLDCLNITLANSSFNTCTPQGQAFTLEDPQGHRIELNSKGEVNEHFTLLSGNSNHSIKFTNLTPGMRAEVTWDFPAGVTPHSKNYLKLSDGSGQHVQKIHHNGGPTTGYFTILDDGAVMIRNAGSGAKAIVITKIKIDFSNNQ